MKQLIHNTDNKGLKEAISTLRKGGIIAFPTDTVYGIGCDAENDSAITRIFKIKKRGRGKPLVMFLSHRRQISDFVVKQSNTRKRLCKHFIPGEITFIMHANRNTPQRMLTRKKTVSIRVPDCGFLRKLLTQFRKPLATTSANFSGEIPARSYKDINLDVDLILRNDHIPSGTPSSILDISLYPFVLKRKGKTCLFTIERYIPSKIRFDKSIVFNVLFVCTGNSCRSPIAEGILKKLIGGKWLKNVNVSSCGILAVGGFPPTKNAIMAVNEHGFDISAHRSRSISKELVEASDLVLCMEKFQKKEIFDLVPGSKDKVFLLTEFCRRGGEIDDPIGGDIKVYRELTRTLEKYVKMVADRIIRRYV